MANRIVLLIKLIWENKIQAAEQFDGLFGTIIIV